MRAPIVPARFLAQTYEVPGTPYVIVLDELGIVRAKGTVNNLEQMEGLVDSAERRVEDAARREGGARCLKRSARTTSVELASRTSRRSFLGRLGVGIVALVGGPYVAAALRPERAEAYHICGHTYTTDSCPHPYRPLSRVDKYGYPVHPKYGYPVDDNGDIYKSKRPDPTAHVSGGRRREVPVHRQSSLRRRMEPVLRGRIRRIADCCSYSRRRINGDASVTGLLLQRHEGVLHRLSRHQRPLLNEWLLAILVIASVVGGISTLFGP